MSQTGTNYNKAKTWQVFCYPLCNTATNFFLILMNFASYLAVGGYGILVTTAAVIISGSRIFDAVTDPVIGFIIDKTDGKFGKFRPAIVIGYLLMSVSLFLMFFVGIGSGIGVFIITYVLYIIGYTFQTAAFKGGLSCVTNDPKQRPIAGLVVGISSVVTGTLLSVVTSNYLVPKHGSLNVPALQELLLIIIAFAGVCTVLSVAAIWSKDNKEYYDSLPKNNIRFRDMWGVIKGNRPLQMLVIAAATDKVAINAASNSSIVIMIFGIVVGNYAFQGQLSTITMIPIILLIIFGTGFARKKGSKMALVGTTWGCIVMTLLIFAQFFFGDPTQISRSAFPTGLFLVMYCAYMGFRYITTAIVNPMIADCADYELYKTGRFMPGTIGTLFSFVDKIVSSFSASIVGFMLASIGFVDVMPQPGDASTPGIFWVGMFCWIGMPLIGWIATLIAMKFYPLDYKKMEEIQASIQEKKQEIKTPA